MTMNWLHLFYNLCWTPEVFRLFWIIFTPTVIFRHMANFLGVKGNAEKMLAEAGGKTMDSLTFQAMMSRRMGQVYSSTYCFH